MTAPLPFEEEVEELLRTFVVRHGVAVRAGELATTNSGTKDAMSMSNGAIAEAKSALLAAHKKEVRRVIGDDLPEPQGGEDDGSYRKGLRYGYNDAKDHMRKRAGIEPEEEK